MFCNRQFECIIETVVLHQRGTETQKHDLINCVTKIDIA